MQWHCVGLGSSHPFVLSACVFGFCVFPAQFAAAALVVQVQLFVKLPGKLDHWSDPGKKIVLCNEIFFTHLFGILPCEAITLMPI